MPSFFDELRAGLSSLLDKVAGDDDGPVPSKSADDIRKALQARAAGRPAPTDAHAIAQRAGAGDEARRARERMARAREDKIRAQRQRRAAHEQRAREAAFADAQRRAHVEAGASAGAGETGSRSRGPRIPFGADRDIAKHYETLNLPVGAPFAEVKKSFRALMRRYHPDMHSGSPDKQKAAAELTKQLTVAYNALEQHLEGT